MKVLNALIGGLAGACAITVLHQVLKRKDEEAPRMDLLGMESIKNVLDKLGIEQPEKGKLYYLTLGGDIASNTLYYSLAGLGKDKTWLKGPALGLAGGLGAVFLPKPLGLNLQHSNKSVKTQLMAVLYYFTGGVVSSAVIKLLESQQNKPKQLILKTLKSKLTNLT
ncbi:hypothetical protein [Mucilaginibacter terrae]|uniref:DUF1440 domain-containing protein n=1 Tax=Mucilaginibacter terrae TaxID=1955052 RepID=A0ABU3GPX4_9SPHI|nr:hypothetical protein [Mucilaginibacter terrae]MDT3401828.1 hypothetical protein [Mucilaginibacter terrae]